MKVYIVLVADSSGGHSQWVRDSVHDDRESAAEVAAELRAAGTPARVIERDEAD